MSDIEHDESEDPQPYGGYDPDIIQRLEVDMLTAIGNEAEAESGIPVTVLSYILAAEVIDQDGNVSMMWTTTDGVSDQAMLGYAHWLLKRVDEAT